MTYENYDKINFSWTEILFTFKIFEGINFPKLHIYYSNLVFHVVFQLRSILPFCQGKTMEHFNIGSGFQLRSQFPLMVFFERAFYLCLISMGYLEEYARQCKTNAFVVEIPSDLKAFAVASSYFLCFGEKDLVRSQLLSFKICLQITAVNNILYLWINCISPLNSSWLHPPW